MTDEEKKATVAALNKNFNVNSQIKWVLVVNRLPTFRAIHRRARAFSRKTLNRFDIGAVQFYTTTKQYTSYYYSNTAALIGHADRSRLPITRTAETLEEAAALFCCRLVIDGILDNLENSDVAV